MFGLQGSSSSPTDPLFRQLGQDCPIRGLTMQTQRLLLACNLQASKRECGRRENEKTEIQGGSNGVRVECQQLRTCPQSNANRFENAVYVSNAVPCALAFQIIFSTLAVHTEMTKQRSHIPPLQASNLNSNNLNRSPIKTALTSSNRSIKFSHSRTGQQQLP